VGTASSQTPKRNPPLMSWEGEKSERWVPLPPGCLGAKGSRTRAAKTKSEARIHRQAQDK